MSGEWHGSEDAAACDAILGVSSTQADVFLAMYAPAGSGPHMRSATRPPVFPPMGCSGLGSTTGGRARAA